MRALQVAVLVLLGLVALAPALSGQAPGTELNARPLSVLEYHPYPDPDRGEEGGDPFGVPFPGGDRDWMAHYYGSFWFPTTRFDGVLESSYARDGSITDMEEFYERYRERVEERRTEDSPLVAVVDGELSANEGNVTVRFTAKEDLQSTRAVLRVVVYEDDVRYDGENGVDVHRFVVREVLPGSPVAGLARGERIAANHTFTVDPSWDPDRLGVVAYVQNEDEASPAWALQEVLQSATYRFAQAGPTVQGERSVLLEMYTATWCPSCVYGDGAVDLLAEEYGMPSALKAQTAWVYLRGANPLLAGAGLLTGLAVAALALPRLRGGGEDA